MGVEKLRAVRALALACVLSMVVVSSAVAHAMLTAASPPVGGQIDVAPAGITLTFTERVEPGLSQVFLTTKDGRTVALSPIRTKAPDRTLEVTIDEQLTPGRYSVGWSVVSVDGHKTIGDFSFTLSP